MAADFILDEKSSFSVDGDAITCMTEISFDESADVYFGSCGVAAGAARTPIVGTKQVTGSVTFEPAKADTALLGYVDIGSTGALLCYPQGNTSTYLKISATTAWITGRQIRISSSGVPTVVANFVADGLTVEAASG